jgi:hydroxyacylglutathione hydrolase
VDPWFAVVQAQRGSRSANPLVRRKHRCASAEYLPLRDVVDELMQTWLAAHRRESYELLVLHTHSHGDHVAGDGQFTDRVNTVLVQADRDIARKFFGFAEDPDAIRPVDLGGRVLEVFATPGHDAAAVTFYDPWTGFLLTGDTVYRGRLYIVDWAAFSRSIERMIEFCQTRAVTHVIGCHIEMSRQPGVDYPVRTTYQPDEVGPEPARRAFDDFILWPEDD